MMGRPSNEATILVFLYVRTPQIQVTPVQSQSSDREEETWS